MRTTIISLIPLVFLVGCGQFSSGGPYADCLGETEGRSDCLRDSYYASLDGHYDKDLVNRVKAWEADLDAGKATVPDRYETDLYVLSLLARQDSGLLEKAVALNASDNFNREVIDAATATGNTALVRPLASKLLTTDPDKYCARPEDYVDPLCSEADVDRFMAMKALRYGDFDTADALFGPATMPTYYAESTSSYDRMITSYAEAVAAKLAQMDPAEASAYIIDNAEALNRVRRDALDVAVARQALLAGQVEAVYAAFERPQNTDLLRDGNDSTARMKWRSLLQEQRDNPEMARLLEVYPSLPKKDVALSLIPSQGIEAFGVATADALARADIDRQAVAAIAHHLAGDTAQRDDVMALIGAREIGMDVMDAWDSCRMFAFHGMGAQAEALADQIEKTAPSDNARAKSWCYSDAAKGAVMAGRYDFFNDVASKADAAGSFLDQSRWESGLDLYRTGSDDAVIAYFENLSERTGTADLSDVIVAATLDGNTALADRLWSFVGEEATVGEPIDAEQNPFILSLARAGQTDRVRKAAVDPTTSDTALFLRAALARE